MTLPTLSLPSGTTFPLPRLTANCLPRQRLSASAWSEQIDPIIAARNAIVRSAVPSRVGVELSAIVRKTDLPFDPSIYVTPLDERAPRMASATNDPATIPDRSAQS